MALVNRLSIFTYGDEVRVLEWSHSLGRKIKIKRWGSFSAAPDTEGRALKERLLHMGIKAKRARAGLAGKDLVVRLVRLPFMSAGDLAGHLQVQAEDYLLVDPAEYRYDYRVVKVFEEEGRRYLSVLLAAVPRPALERWYAVFKGAGLYVEFVDAYPNALGNLFAGQGDRDAAVLDVGREGTRVTFWEKGSLFLYTYLEEGWAGDGLARVLSDARAYFDFYTARHFGRDVDEVYLVGDLALDPKARREASDVLGREVTGDVPPRCYGAVLPGVGREVLPAYAANLGLIFRGRRL